MRIGLIASLLAALTPAIATAAGPAATPGLSARIAELPALLADPAGYDSAFTPRFRRDVPRRQWQTLLTQLGAIAGKPRSVAQVDITSPTSARVRIQFERALIGLRIDVAATAPHQIAGLLVTGPVAAEATIAAVIAALQALPGTTALSIATLGTDAPTPVDAIADDRAMSVGSEFKLVILAELIRAVSAGHRQWDDLIRLDGQPLPGGRYTAQPAGTKVTIRELATAMIAASDNSATDILIAALGRNTIEAMLPEVGIARPAGMRPFLTTLEAFRVKTMIAGGDTAWLAADENARRALLVGPVATVPLAAIDRAFAPRRPIAIEAVEWRASPDDIVRLLDWIRRHTETGPAAAARAILAQNPGVGPDAAAGWRYLGYKGGSEPGVIAMSLLLQRDTGGWLALSAAWNDPTDPVDELRFVALISRLVELLRDGG